MGGVSIAERILEVEGQVAAACRESGRSADRIKLIAVGKSQSVDVLRAAYHMGLRRFAENYVQEAVTKQSALAGYQDIEWHFIGHLQRNKVRLVVGAFELVQSVDSVRLAEAISRVAQEKGLIQRVLLEINLAGEESKSGFAPADLLRCLRTQLAELSGLSLCGLMSFPPLAEDPEVARDYFRESRGYFEQCQELVRGTRHEEAFCELSMGTSSDYYWALLEGATMVRLGTTLFGPRQ